MAQHQSADGSKMRVLNYREPKAKIKMPAVKGRRMVKLPEQTDLPPGDTYLCPFCRTRIRTGQPHSAVYPTPHVDYAALTVGEES